MELSGKYGSAIVYNDYVEQEAISQIIGLLNHPAAENAQVRIMPDVHAGAGCVIGYTARLTDKIVPNLIGVDIGCSILGYNLGKNLKLQFDKLDAFIRDSIPYGGGSVNGSIDYEYLERIFPLVGTKVFDSWSEFSTQLSDVCRLTGQNKDYVFASLGSLGSGNHFISVEKDDDGSYWLLVHSGSRNFGTKVAEYHQTIAEEHNYTISKEEFEKQVNEIRLKKKGKSIEYAIDDLRKSIRPKTAVGLEYLEGAEANAYKWDMKVAQVFAQVNRMTMLHKMISFYKEDYNPEQKIETVHNYINFDDGIVRKGAVSAHAGERLFIPMNMEYGTLLCIGKGNPDWNESAPHGAGRVMSRSKAKATISLEKYQERMKGIWTSCVGKATIDEAPQAYKNPDEIIEYIEPTVDIISRLATAYNFKAGD